jgi:hypothetical protein
MEKIVEPLIVLIGNTAYRDTNKQGRGKPDPAP